VPRPSVNDVREIYLERRSILRELVLATLEVVVQSGHRLNDPVATI